ncbi:DUF1684 domain-containing protein [Pontibacter sp. H259]|uniref:DUF1684 domain-containing protein n=1 Tax=Pontibacter sp. H259 TaxID=3133421 RepID=UPI0030BF9ABF
MKSIKATLLLTISIILLSACTNTEKSEDPAAYEASINEWHTERLNNLKKEDGWLALAGLFWLEPGKNTFGSATDNNIVFPEGKIAAHAGAFILEGNQVKTILTPDANVLLDGKTIQEALIYTSGDTLVPRLKHNSLTWFVIERGGKYGVRLLDTESEIRTNFKGIDRYKVDPAYRLEATLEPNTTGRKIAITNIVGQTSDEETPGALVFTLDGKTHKLDALKEGEQLFVIFADKTNGHQTYGAGRYLYTNLPDANGKVILDFNKAYNPPCAFVTYATCPLPPKQNFLPVPVPAGEKAFEESH